MPSTLFDLSGQVALVTGSTKGIGKSIAQELARAGARVVVSSRKAEACEAVRAEFEREGLAAIAKPCNVSHKDEVEALVAHTVSTWGKIDVLVCNAAVNPYYGPLAKLPDDTFGKVMTANLQSSIWLSALVAPGMAERGGGCIILVGSIGGILGTGTLGIYGMSKAADHALARNLAVEWGPRNVRVNAIAPGLIKTDFARALWEDEKLRSQRESITPLRRIGAPEEIGGIAVFLASKAGSFITGQTIVADGGVTIV
ncbi:MAG: SDR family oxidoreductase [Burkholderiales bacterium]|nr:SDR family oxidoreductase [Burkholderiales bacterium]